MKIAIVLPHFYPYVGGAEKMFYDLAKGMVKAGHEVKVVARNVGEEYLGTKTMEGMEIKYCPWKSMFGHPFPKKKDIEEVMKWCDVVHTSIFTTSPVVSRLAKKYKKPSLLTIYEARGPKWYWADNFIKATIFWLVEQFSCRQKFDCYHAISEATKQDVEKYCKRKNVRRVYLANEMGKTENNSDFSLREYFGIAKEDEVFLYYGRPGKTKGVMVYEKAIEELVQRNLDLSHVKFCFILGKEPEDLRAEFVKLIQKKGLGDIVKIKESVDRKALSACIAQADTVVVPSLTEGFGFSALEACQIGTRLLYSNGGSLPEVVYGKCKAFENRDPISLANGIQSVLEKKDAAFEEIPEKEFTYEEMIGGIEKLYEELVKK